MLGLLHLQAEWLRDVWTGLVITVEVLRGVSLVWMVGGECLTEESETVSSAAGMVKPLMVVEDPNGSMNRSLVSVLARPSAKSKDIGSISAGARENRSMALS